MRLSAGFDRLARMQHARPWAFVLAALGMAAVSLPFAAQLRLNGDFTALLPEDKPSVRDLDIIEERFGGKSTLTLMFQHPDLPALREFVREVGTRLENLDGHGIVSVDWSLKSFIDFVERNRFLYADIDDLEAFADELQARLTYEMAKANPLLVDLQEGPPPQPEEVAAQLEEAAAKARQEMDRYPEGFFQHPDQPLIAIFVRTSIRGGDPSTVQSLLDAVDRIVRETRESTGHPVDYDLGGDLMDIKEESDALTRAVIFATSITIVLVLCSIYFFFRRIRSIPLLGLSLLSPVLATFAVAYATVEFLNASTAFLSSIVVGNGINPNVIWLARYFEIRRQGADPQEALRRTHSSTWAATLTASLAAGLAYGSLIITEFRGFRDFGMIGGTGMALCWLGAYTILPALTVLFDRKFDNRAPTNHGERKRLQYGAVFAELSTRNPRVILVAASVLMVASGVALSQWLIEGPLEYDFRNLQSVRPSSSRVQWVNDRQEEMVNETTTGSAIAILLDSRDQAESVVHQLEQMKEEDPDLLGAIRTVDDFVPQLQEDKLDVLDEIRRVMPRLREHANEDQQKLLDENRPPEDLEVLAASDLPESVARLFTDRQGELGRVVFVEHHEDRNAWDGKYLIEWSDAARAVRLQNGDRPPVVGQPAIFSDLLDAIFDDGPQAVGVALAATALLVFFAFRGMAERLFTIGALLLGILWMAALMAVGGIKLNFLNFVAFPITFGNGVDYGVNVMRRYVQEMEGGKDAIASIKEAVHETGGAVILCSLTTIIGYISLYTSSNKALNSFGAAMAISEVTCVVAGVLVIPAALASWSRRRSGPQG